jgi:hypothetical protein
MLLSSRDRWFGFRWSSAVKAAISTLRKFGWKISGPIGGPYDNPQRE